MAGTSLLFHVFDANIVSFSEKKGVLINLLCCSLGYHAIFLVTGVVCHDVDMCFKRVALRDFQRDQKRQADPVFFKGGRLVPQGCRMDMPPKCYILRIGT